MLQNFPTQSKSNYRIGHPKKRPNLVFLVLSGVGVAGDDCSNPDSRGNLAGIDHDEQLHEVIIHLSTPALNDVHVFSSHTLSYLHTGGREGGSRGRSGERENSPRLLVGEFLQRDFAEFQPQPLGDGSREVGIRVPAEHLDVGHL